MERAFLVVFFILFAMAITWLVLLRTLFARLERRHPEEFEEMGKPRVFWNNSAKNSWAMLGFLFRREHRGLGDPALSRLSDFMLALFVAYLALFVGMVLLFACVLQFAAGGQ